MWRLLTVVFALNALLACHAQRAPESLPTAALPIGGERFEIELALDPASRHKGLGGRRAIGAHAGMLLVYSSPARKTTVMRDTLVPIDVAFLDPQGRVLTTYTMPPEPPRRPGESQSEYEARLPRYPSGRPAQFVLELAGDRLAELGISPGDGLHFNWRALARRASITSGTIRRPK